MEIDRRTALAGLTGIAATAALGIPALGAAQAFTSDAEPVMPFARHYVLMIPPPGTFSGPVVSAASFGEGALGFEALKSVLRWGEWIIAGKDHDDPEPIDRIIHASRDGVQSSGLKFRPVSGDGSFAVRAYHLEPNRIMPTPEALLLLTHAARFAGLHAKTVFSSYNYRGDGCIQYPPSGGFDEAVIEGWPKNEAETCRLRALLAEA